MKYRVEYTPQATKELSKLDPHTRRTIKEWIDRHLENCENPRAYGKALTPQTARGNGGTGLATIG